MKKLIIFCEEHGDLQPQEHVAFAVVKEIQLRHLLAEVIAVHDKAVGAAVFEQPGRARGFVINTGQIDAGEHPGESHLDIHPLIAAVPLAGDFR